MNKIDKQLNGESKYLDTSGSTVAAFIVQPLCLMQQGDSAITRTGNSVIGKNLQVRFSIQQTGATPNQSMRVMLVLDRQPNQGAAPIAGANGILASTSFQAFPGDPTEQGIKL